MKTTRLAVLGAMAAVGCSFHVDFVPSNVQQEIGANHLSKSTARWTCDAGEELVYWFPGNVTAIGIA